MSAIRMLFNVTLSYQICIAINIKPIQVPYLYVHVLDFKNRSYAIFTTHLTFRNNKIINSIEIWIHTVLICAQGVSLYSSTFCNIVVRYFSRKNSITYAFLEFNLNYVIFFLLKLISDGSFTRFS